MDCTRCDGSGRIHEAGCATAYSAHAGCDCSGPACGCLPEVRDEKRHPQAGPERGPEHSEEYLDRLASGTGWTVDLGD